MTILTAYRTILTKLSDFQSLAPTWARDLITHIMDRDYLDLAPDQTLTSSQLDKLRRILSLLEKEFPPAYLVGHTEFYGLKIKIEEGVLIPRPETEGLVDILLQTATSLKAKNVLEVGSGSGCIAAAFLSNVSYPVNYIACDPNPLACKLTLENISFHNKHRDTVFSIANYRVLEIPKLPFTPEIIASNPPYLTLEEMSDIPCSVSYEPRLALEAGSDGLDVYREILEVANRLEKLPILIFEISPIVAKPLQLLLSNSYSHIEVTKDAWGRERYLVADNNSSARSN